MRRRAGETGEAAFKNTDRKHGNREGEGVHWGERGKGERWRQGRAVRVNSWIWPGGLLNNVAPLKKDS